MTHTSTEQPEALRIANELDDEFGFYGEARRAVETIHRLHARVLELEAELEKAKASVSGLKKRSDDWKWRALNAEASQARAPLSDEQIEPIAIDVLGYGALSEPDMDLFTQSVRAIERAHGITQEKQG